MMSIKDFCQVDVVTVSKDCSVKEAAKLMKENCVGNVVVVDDNKNKTNPCGMLTDRDIVLYVVADDKECDVSVSEVMSNDILTVPQDCGLKETIELLQEKAVRRAPIVDENNKVVGITAVDDIIPFLTKELYCVANLIDHQVKSAHA